MPLPCGEEQVNNVYSVEEVIQTLKRLWAKQTIGWTAKPSNNTAT